MEQRDQTKDDLVVGNVLQYLEAYESEQDPDACLVVLDPIKPQNNPKYTVMG